MIRRPSERSLIAHDSIRSRHRSAGVKLLDCTGGSTSSLPGSPTLNPMEVTRAPLEPPLSTDSLRRFTFVGASTNRDFPDVEVKKDGPAFALFRLPVFF